MTWQRRVMNVNELLQLLQEYYECNTVVIRGIKVANLSNQFNPEKKVVDFGGVLNLHIDIYTEPFKTEIKDAPNTSREKELDSSS